MLYKNVVYGQFKRRVNRFIAEVVIDEKTEHVHIKNTGRLKELLVPGTKVLLENVNHPNRKTQYSIIAVVKSNHWVNIDSQAPNKVAFEAIKAGKITEFGMVKNLKREVTFDSSRFDLYYEKNDEKGFIEVKGVTLRKGEIAMFPDAPTARGTKHILELIDTLQEGYKATILFIIQMEDCHTFTPNMAMDQPFVEALLKAKKAGVQILAYDCVVDENSIMLNQSVPVKLPSKT